MEGGWSGGRPPEHRLDNVTHTEEICERIFGAQKLIMGAIFRPPHTKEPQRITVMATFDTFNTFLTESEGALSFGLPEASWHVQMFFYVMEKCEVLLSYNISASFGPFLAHTHQPQEKERKKHTHQNTLILYAYIYS